MFGESFVEHGMERRPSVQVLEWSTKKVYKDASAPMFEEAAVFKPGLDPSNFSQQTLAPSESLQVQLFLTYGGFHKWGYPKMDQNGWFIMESPVEMNDLGIPQF